MGFFSPSPSLHIWSSHGYNSYKGRIVIQQLLGLKSLLLQNEMYIVHDNRGEEAVLKRIVTFSSTCSLYGTRSCIHILSSQRKKKIAWKQVGSKSYSILSIRAC